MKITIDVEPLDTSLPYVVVKVEVEVDGTSRGKVKIYPTPCWKSAYQRATEITLVELRDTLVDSDPSYPVATNEFTIEEWERVRDTIKDGLKI